MSLQKLHLLLKIGTKGNTLNEQKAIFEQFAQALPTSLEVVLPRPEHSQDDTLTYNHYSQVWGMAYAPQNSIN